MLALWVLAAVTLVVSGAPTLEDTRISGENGWYVPQIDGSFDWWTIEEAETRLGELEAAQQRELSLNPVTYYLYTDLSSKKQKIKATESTIQGSTFNSNHPTRFVIHGWTQSHSSSMNSDIRKALFRSSAPQTPQPLREFIYIEPPSFSGEPGESVRLTWQPTTSITLVYKWTKDGYPLYRQRNLVIDVNQLEIRDSTTRDSGVYTCLGIDLRGGRIYTSDAQVLIEPSYPDGGGSNGGPVQPGT